jgi:hypothetical protein
VHLPVITEDQRFELFSLDLWRRRLNDPDAQRFGRNGQKQFGIDILGTDRAGQSKISGIQCKLPIKRPIRALDLDREVAKAISFIPKLGKFWFSYAGPRDAQIQQRAAEISAKHSKQGTFDVHAYSWDDLQEEITHWPSLIDMYWPNLGTWRDFRMSRSRSGKLKAEISLSAEADLAVAELFNEMEIRSLLDQQVCSDIRTLFAELALNAHDHGGSKRMWITFGSSSIDVQADGVPFNPLKQPASAGAGLRVVRRFEEQYGGRIRVAWNHPSLRLHALADRAFNHDLCVTTYDLLVSRSSARQAATQVTFPPNCMFYTVVMPKTVTRSGDRAFVEAVMEQAPQGKMVVFQGPADSLREEIISRLGPFAGFSPTDGPPDAC